MIWILNCSPNAILKCSSKTEQDMPSTWQATLWSLHTILHHNQNQPKCHQIRQNKAKYWWEQAVPSTWRAAWWILLLWKRPRPSGKRSSSRHFTNVTLIFLQPIIATTSSPLSPSAGKCRLRLRQALCAPRRPCAAIHSTQGAVCVHTVCCLCAHCVRAASPLAREAADQRASNPHHAHPLLIFLQKNEKIKNKR